MTDMTAEFEYEGRKRVLVIDDDEDILNWFRLLQKQESPYSISVLQNELDILRTIDEVKPDLIFIDIYLSSINGKKLSEIIRIGQLYTIPVVHMSSRELSQTEVAGQTFMRKPLERKAVDAKIRKLLKI